MVNLQDASNAEENRADELTILVIWKVSSDPTQNRAKYKYFKPQIGLTTWNCFYYDFKVQTYLYFPKSQSPLRSNSPLLCFQWLFESGGPLPMEVKLRPLRPDPLLWLAEHAVASQSKCDVTVLCFEKLVLLW